MRYACKGWLKKEQQQVLLFQLIAKFNDINFSEIQFCMLLGKTIFKYSILLNRGCGLKQIACHAILQCITKDCLSTLFFKQACNQYMIHIWYFTFIHIQISYMIFHIDFKELKGTQWLWWISIKQWSFII